MKEIFDLFRDVLSPESDWGSFTRKIIGVAAAIATAAVGVTIYTQYALSDKGEKPAQVVLDRSKGKRQAVRRIIETIQRLHPLIKSVWVYGWPDAVNLIPIMFVGESHNPIPASVFDSRDAPNLGYFLLDECKGLDRPFINLTCPINGFEGVWGVIVVTFHDTPPPSVLSQIEGLANRVGLILYTNNQHSGQID
jgi:hypothetical protein